MRFQTLRVEPICLGFHTLEVLDAASSFSGHVIGNMTDLIGTNVSVDPTFELVEAPTGFGSCGSKPSTHQLSYAAALALAPPNVRETVLMRILETAVLLHGIHLPVPIDSMPNAFLLGTWTLLELGILIFYGCSCAYCGCCYSRPLLHHRCTRLVFYCRLGFLLASTVT